jgi:hypothetical protein
VEETIDLKESFQNPERKDFVTFLSTQFGGIVWLLQVTRNRSRGR